MANIPPAPKQPATADIDALRRVALEAMARFEEAVRRRAASDGS